MSIVAGIREFSDEELYAHGCSAHDIKNLRWLGQIYFGDTKYTRIQEKARHNTHSLETLLTIEKHVAKVRTSLDKWRLREVLCATPVDQIDRVAKKHRPAPPTLKAGVRLRRGKTLWSVTVTGKSSQIADLWKSLDKDHPVESLLKGSSPTTLTTLVTVTLPELTQVIHGDHDVELRMANGARITGKDFVQRMFTQHGFVTLISPCAGPVNLYRTSRLANWKQRFMLAAETNTCAWPGCHHPVEDCQMHHIVPWVEGGQTNIENLAPLCPYHNGINDDHREGRRGYIDRIDGKIVWIPPWANHILTTENSTGTTGSGSTDPGDGITRWPALE